MKTIQKAHGEKKHILNLKVKHKRNNLRTILQMTQKHIWVLGVKGSGFQPNDILGKVLQKNT